MFGKRSANMRYGITLFLIIVACIFMIVPKITGNQSNGISNITATPAEKHNIEIGVRETIQYFKKYKQNLKDEVKIVSVNKLSAYSTLVNEYKLSESQAELVAVGRGFYMGNTIFINTQIADNRVIQIGTVAHELTHHYQKQLTKSTDSLFWLQEGMADVTAGNILEECSQTVPQLIPISQLDLPANLNLTKLRSNEDWIQSVAQYGADAVYIYSSIAVRELIFQTSYWSLIEFHTELNRNKNIEKSFKKAFHIELDDFEKKIAEDIKGKKKERFYYKYY